VTQDIEPHHLDTVYYEERLMTASVVTADACLAVTTETLQDYLIARQQTQGTGTEAATQGELLQAILIQQSKTCKHLAV